MPESKNLQGLTNPKYQEKLRNARLCNNDKSIIHLSRKCLMDAVKALVLLAFLDERIECTLYLYLWKIGSE